MLNNSDNDKEMDDLSKAIVESILNSEDVKRSLKKMQKTSDSAKNSIMVFMVRLDSLSEQAEKEKGIEACRLKPKKRKPRKKIGKPEVIDGKTITGNEQKFLDFLSENFDQKEWLKRNKISLD